MTQFKLGINTGFCLNRFPEPEEWTKMVGEVLGIRYVNFTASLLSPSLPENIIKNQIARVTKASAEHNVKITHTFTDAFTRVNHIAHPDDETRKHWISWFKRFAEISAELGAISMGSHFGIFSARDLKERKDFIFSENIRAWGEISDHAKSLGLKYLTWEPMSVAREQGHTLEEARRIHEAVNKATAIPMKFCLDVDHGDVSSPNPQDTDPYAWLKTFGKDSPIIDIKQSYANKGGHWPFTPEHNARGKIFPDKVLKTLEEAGAEECQLTLEMSFREREPAESNVLKDLKASADFWREHVKE